MGMIGEGIHNIRVPFGTGILCWCVYNSPYIIIMVDVEGKSESQKRQLEPVWRGNEAFRTS